MPIPVSQAADLRVATSERAARGRIVVIDSLRGIAALLVLAFHALLILTISPHAVYRLYGLRPNLNAYLHYALIPFLESGYIGVMIFFALSGYCTHRAGARRLALGRSGLDLKTFYLRRLWRIYPVYIAALLLTVGIDHWRFAHGYTHGHVELIHATSVRTFYVNLFSLQELAGPIFGSNLVFWTLGIEIHFYLVYPILYLISRSRGPLAALFTTFAVSAVTVFIAQRVNFHPRTFPQFWFSWGIGFYVAEVAAGRAHLPRLSVLMPIALLAGILAMRIHFSGLERWAELVMPLATGGLLIATLTPAGMKFGTGYFGRPLAAVGVFSYSLYATHYPILLLLRAIFWPSGAPVSLLPAVAGGALCVGIAWLCFLLIEQWSLTLPDAAACAASLSAWLKIKTAYAGRGLATRPQASAALADLDDPYEVAPSVGVMR